MDESNKPRFMRSEEKDSEGNNYIEFKFVGSGPTMLNIINENTEEKYRIEFSCCKCNNKDTKTFLVKEYYVGNLVKKYYVGNESLHWIITCLVCNSDNNENGVEI
jgi:hypothetical protein